MSREPSDSPNMAAIVRPPRRRWGPWVAAVLVAVVLGVGLGLFVPVNGHSPLAEQLGWHLPATRWPAPPPETAGTTTPPAATTAGATSGGTTAPAPPERLEPRPIAAAARKAHVPVLMYHDVVDQPKKVWFDVTLAQFDKDLAAIAEAGATPVSLAQWWAYLTRAEPLPAKPVLITFDDGYESIYRLIYPRLKKRNWPAVYFIVTSTVGRKTGKDHVTWEQIQEMRASGLCDFQAHTVTHPKLTTCSDEALHRELVSCRDLLQKKLEQPIQFLCYPVGDRDERVIKAAQQAGFVAAFTMTTGGSAQSPDVMQINRYPCQDLATALEKASCQLATPKPAPVAANGTGTADGAQPVLFHRQVVKVGKMRVPLCWVTGGRMVSVLADYRYAVPDVARMAKAPAAINGGFFQMAKIRDTSNAMLGPVMCQWTTQRDEEVWRERTIAQPSSLLAQNQFAPGNPRDNERLIGRPLVLMSPGELKFVAFNPNQHNTREGLEKALPGVTDAFVAGGWLVQGGQALDRQAMDEVSTRDHHDPRRRAFCGIDRQGRPVIGASPCSQSSAVVARCLQQIGLVDAALLDSGFSSSLYYNGSIFVTGHSDEQPSRPVPHILLLERPTSPATQALGVAVGRVDGQVRAAQNNLQWADLPPNSRLADVDRPAPPEPAERRPRRRARRRR